MRNSWSLCITAALLAGSLYAEPASARATGGIDAMGVLHTIAGEVTPLDITVTLTGTESLYDAAEPGARRADSISAQTVHATATDSGFFQIDTWLGPKWMAPVNKIIYNLEATRETLTLSGRTPVYSFPNGNEEVVAELSSQNVTSFESAAGGWYHIHTWLGDQWVNPDLHVPTEQQPSTGRMDFVGDQAVYSYPDTRSKTLGFIRPQTLAPIEQTTSGNWYHVRVNEMDGWVQLDPSFVPQQVETRLRLTKDTVLWTTPSAGDMLASLSPQQVSAFQKWNNWFRIHTWLGDAWVFVES